MKGLLSFICEAALLLIQKIAKVASRTIPIELSMRSSSNGFPRFKKHKSSRLLSSLICGILCLGLLAQQTAKFCIVLNYQINQEVIAKTLCEKKEIPKNTCHGKCHLKKQLEKVSLPQEEEEGTTITLPEIFLSLAPSLESVEELKNTAEKLVIPNNKLTTKSFTQKVFHPPCA